MVVLHGPIDRWRRLYAGMSDYVIGSANNWQWAALGGDALVHEQPARSGRRSRTGGTECMPRPQAPSNIWRDDDAHRQLPIARETIGGPRLEQNTTRSAAMDYEKERIYDIDEIAGVVADRYNHPL